MKSYHYAKQIIIYYKVTKRHVTFVPRMFFDKFNHVCKTITYTEKSGISIFFQLRIENTIWRLYRGVMKNISLV